MSPPMHSRDAVAEAVDGAAGDDTVVFCGLGSSSRAWRARNSPRPAYYGSDPMGLSLPLATGFAVGRPDRTVVLLVGDGDLLMGLGALVTVADVAPPNLRVVVLANGRYETGGGQPVPGEHADLVALARAAGWERAEWATNDVRADVGASLAASGVALLAVHVPVEPAPYGGPGRWSGVEERTLFELRLGDRGN